MDADDRGAENLGLAELAEAAGVSIRTVRYYIAEGLLPPPVGAGPRAAYRPEHLDRLRLVARLKAAYLPLREIRRRLRGLDAAAVHALLANAPPTAPPSSVTAEHRDTAAREDDGSAAAYLARLLPPPADSAPVSAPLAPPSSPPRGSAADLPAPPVGFPPRTPEVMSGVDAPVPALLPASAADLTRADLDRGATLAALATLDSGPDSVSDLAAEPWRRLSLGPDAELLIRADAYARQREQIDALVAWARRALG